MGNRLDKEPKTISYTAEARVFHRSIVNNLNGYKAIEPCYTRGSRGKCPNLDKTGETLCKIENELEHGQYGLECPLQNGSLKVIYENDK